MFEVKKIWYLKNLFCHLRSYLNGFLIAGHNGGTHSKPDECHQDDL